MAVEIQMDYLQGPIEGDESQGSIQRFTHTGLAQGITKKDFAAVMQVLDSPNAPQYGDVLTSGVKTYPNLVVLDRHVKILGPNNFSKGIITVTYGKRSLLDNLQVVNIESRMNSETTIQSGTGQIIVGSSVFNNSHPLFPGVTITQAIPVQVDRPLTTLTITGKVPTDYPLSFLVKDWQAHINAAPWAGEEAGQWLVTRVAVEEKDIGKSPKEWRVTFEIQHRIGGWALVGYPRDPLGFIASDISVVTSSWYPQGDFGRLLLLGY